MKKLFCLIILLCFSSLPVFCQSPFEVDATPQAIAIQEQKADSLPELDLQGSTQQAIDYYSKRYSDPDEAWGESLNDRNRIDPTNIPLRDAEHYWWARAQVQNAKWYAKLYKAFQQSICTVGYSTYKLLRAPITGNTTPPSFREMKWGLVGVWDGLFPPPMKEK